MNRTETTHRRASELVAGDRLADGRQVFDTFPLNARETAVRIKQPGGRVIQVPFINGAWVHVQRRPHEGHRTGGAVVAAPGIGTMEYCYDCRVSFNDANVRMLTLEDVR